MAKPTAISLFAGCGGSDHALQAAGFRIVWANDIWGLACATYKDNISAPRIHEGDVRDFDRFPDAQLLVGGEFVGIRHRSIFGSREPGVPREVVAMA